MTTKLEKGGDADLYDDVASGHSMGDLLGNNVKPRKDLTVVAV